MTPTAVVRFFEPYEFSPFVALMCGGFLWLFLRGRRRLATDQHALGPWRTIGFLIGLLLMYTSLQTRFDYFAQHMFFLHRLQHLLLHHLAPFLIAFSAPQAAIMAGLPGSWRQRAVLPILRNRWVSGLYRTIQQPFVSGFIFVALIYLWLYPGIHFYAMLNVPLYNAMNWSMAIDGLLFWWMVFNLNRSGTSLTAYFGSRIVVLFLIVPVQILVGAYIALSHEELYTVYAICGRLWPITAQADQELGGLITWIPACMMSVIAVLIVLSRWIHRDRVIDPKPESKALAAAAPVKTVPLQR